MNAINQQLAFAKVQAKAATDANSAFMRRAHWQAGVFQLGLALECYAAELQEAAKVKMPLKPGSGMFAQLRQDFVAAGKASAEVDELAYLEQDSTSWLGILQQWAKRLVNIGAGSGRRSVLAETSLAELEKSDTGLINLVEVANELAPPPFDEALFYNIIEQATALIERQRENSAEY